ncbi:MAG: FeoB small GTPase domain-containing protein, partial [Oscillospiraceae bacterium]
MSPTNALSPGGAERVVALAGNPNVGKSTVFNELTGFNQHTGNWPGKTVTGARGRCKSGGHEFVLVDLPGTYSLLAHSAEEEVARDFICFGGADATVVVCDATCLERSLNLALQTLEITSKTVICVNLMDEARKKKITIDFEQLSRELGVAVVKTSARSGNGLGLLLEEIDKVVGGAPSPAALRIPYPAPIERA